MSEEAEVRGHKKIVGQGIAGQYDRQRNQKMAYLLWKALPKPFDSIHLLHCIGTQTGCQSKSQAFKIALRETSPQATLSGCGLPMGINEVFVECRIDSILYICSSRGRVSAVFYPGPGRPIPCHGGTPYRRTPVRCGH